MPIGVFDSGLGGLTVLRALTEAAPWRPFVYLGDNANAPYGVRPPEEIYRLTCAGVERLFEEGCRAVVIACNTASAAALRRLQQEWLPEKAPDRRVLGVLVPMVEALTGRDWADPRPPAPHPVGPLDVVLFATPATVASGAFEREAANRASDLRAASEPCPGLVDALESGDWAQADAIARICVEKALRRMPAPDAAVLACTHYPLAEAAFRAALPPGTRIFAQPAITAASLDSWLARHPGYLDSDRWRAPKLLTTGDPAHVSEMANRFFGLPLAFGEA
ncbi:glutamate racemase [Neomegalonema perideroedes]|uniref:glutamate racemase n=1 Tax=Neomegalonema perideroedes TaxID=217219 RepID=UPI000379BDB2|nr:aspartate/glutamate racemase family protein [Neomegalonema perideroedes]